MSEEQFSEWLRRRLPGDVQRIEPSIRHGIPDISWCHQGTEIWIETKVLTKGRVLLRKLQYSWGMRRSHHGGHVFVASLDQGSVWLHNFPFECVPHGQAGKYVEAPLGLADRHDMDEVSPLLDRMLSLSSLPRN